IAISFRNGNCDYEVNNLRVYRSRLPSVTVSVGAASTNDVRYQNANPASPSCRINSITKDAAGNLSAVASQDVNVDWTVPSGVSVNDGIASDIDTTYSLTQLSANWTLSTDVNSGIAKYYYAIGTTAGATDIVGWTNNGMSTSVTRTGLSLTPGQYYFISAKSEDGAGLISNPVSSDGQLVLMATGINNLSNGTNLIAYPNPFNETATVIYNLKDAATVELTLVDVLGKQIIVQPKENMQSGKHELTINKNELNLASGMYILRLTTDNKSVFTKLTVQ
ncbi:MAG: T9SS type A sorting domain-containing protein, partial [Bacteroidia bacterium]